MRIDSITEDSNNSPWEVYENYRKNLFNKKNQKDDKTDPLSMNGACNTCDNRKYQDGSGDPGVSFKTPTKIDPSQAASAVRGHEMEHVVRNQAQASRENRKVVSQSVTYQNAICPECGSVYMSGGTTRTVTKGETEQPDPRTENGKPILDRYA